MKYPIRDGGELYNSNPGCIHLYLYTVQVNDPYSNNEAAVGAVTAPVTPDVTDLSLHHSSLGVLSKEPSSGPQTWSKYALSSEQVDKFWRDGYLSNIPVLTEDQCDLLLAEYAPFLASWRVSHLHSMALELLLYFILFYTPPGSLFCRTLISSTQATGYSMSSIVIRVGHLTMFSCTPWGSGGSHQPSMMSVSCLLLL